MRIHPLTNLEIQKYYKNELKFNGVYSINNLPKIKDGAYIINLNEYESIGTHWIALYVNAKKITYSDSFGDINIITNIYRIKAHGSIMCWYCCIGFIDFMLKGKSLLAYTNLCSSNDLMIMKRIIK